MQFLKKIKSTGPAILITSAFIGPGTVTVCSLAGYSFVYALLWGLVFSVFATIILQEMAARLGLVTQQGLGEALRGQINHPFWRLLSLLLVFCAIIIGNGAYEAGNISGAVLGMDTALGSLNVQVNGGTLNLWGLIIGIIAMALLFSGSYKLIEKTLIGLVLLMSIVFIVTALMVGPDLGAMIKGMLVPTVPEVPAGGWLMVIGLVGTTVVPYNLFLHASSVSEKWKSPDDLPAVRFDTVVAVVLGGIISMAIVVTSAAASQQAGSFNNAADLAIQLEPLLGRWAKYFMAGGLFAAGISSAITAPLAASYVAAGIFGFKPDLKEWKFKLTGGLILFIGVLFSLLGFKPIHVIKFAQMANGILLPFIAIFLVWMVNRASLLGSYKNNLRQNIFAGIIILVTLFLSAKSILSVLGYL
ncbi:MAG: Nramp family divalent metal transporter [Saprospiraceae bacterium]|nr:Nramp family divalent metal transporter [Saprospiraceae bacterium]MCB9323539.1 Nramp family divalent metal transporter [Lewinellaceae bacterium]